MIASQAFRVTSCAAQLITAHDLLLRAISDAFVDCHIYTYMYDTCCLLFVAAPRALRQGTVRERCF
eukprot:1247209-Pleurochrysis_carterae.AAC.1